MIENQQQQQPTHANKDEIFVANPEPSEPPSKRSVWFTVAMTALGVLILVIVLLTSLYASATSIAKNYSSLAGGQLAKISKPLGELAPTKVLNNRDMSAPVNKIYVSKQAQPSLESIIFVDGINPTYKKAQDLNQDVKKHYSSVDAYTDGLKKMLAYDDFTEQTFAEDELLEATMQVNDALSLRSMKGSYQEISESIAKQDASKQLEKNRQALVDSYKKRAAIYENWATQVESGDVSQEAANRAAVQAEKTVVATLTTDEVFAKLFISTYKDLLKTQKSLQASLNNL